MMDNIGFGCALDKVAFMGMCRNYMTHLGRYSAFLSQGDS